ncbi:MAG: GDSL family lipase [Peptococcaceae bacterium]|nr:GDSL family lipase [Peptococcaceae bacterium]
MRIYRLQIRIIQLSVLITIIIMIFGLVNIWQGSAKGQPVNGNNTAQSGNSSDNAGKVNSNTPQTNAAAPVDNSKPANTKIVCLGDSFTYGYPGQPKDSWPDRLAGVLKIEVVNGGKVYQNSGDLLERFDQDVIAKKPGRVVIFAGVGDALREKKLDEYQKNIKSMVEKAQANQIKPILALPVPYPGTDKLCKEYRDWEQAYAREKNLVTLDFKGVLYDADGKMLKKYSDDGKYPNKNGYQAMGDYAATVLK